MRSKNCRFYSSLIFDRSPIIRNDYIYSFLTLTFARRFFLLMIYTIN